MILKWELERRQRLTKMVGEKLLKNHQKCSNKEHIFILIATSCCYLYSLIMVILALYRILVTITFFDTNNTLLTFIEISKRIVQKTNLALQNLSRNCPKKTRVFRSQLMQQETFVDYERIQVIDLIKIGDNVLAGALNLNSPIIIKSTANELFIVLMILLPKYSHCLKISTQLQADCIARYFIPGILAFSLITFIS